MSAAARKLTVFALSLVVLRALRQDLGRERARARTRPAPPPRPPRRAPRAAPRAAVAVADLPAARPAGDRSGAGFFVALLVLGAALLAVVAGDLLVRGPRRVPTRAAWSVAGGDPDRGRAAIERHGCGSCHVIPGIREARGRVGPQLVDFASQMYVAGVLANVPENLVRWLQDPRAVDPLTAMPDLGVTEEEARDMAAYLYSTP